ncbi:MAG: hypothetical protein ACK4GL_09130 [Flavobacteriales bacterium]
MYNEKPKTFLSEVEEGWKQVRQRLEEQFGGEIDIQAALFLIGVQELGKGRRKYSKDQKLEVIHIAICTLLEPYGYYQFQGKDKDGFPHWTLNEKLPALTSGQQLALMKEAVVKYFQHNELL